MTISEKIRTAPNAREINRILPDGRALIRSGRLGWVYAEYGNAQSFPESFYDARNRAAEAAARNEQID